MKKKLLLVTGGVILGLLLSEAGLRVFLGRPTLPARDPSMLSDVYWRYLDIHDNFFKLKPGGKEYTACRPFSTCAVSFAAKKTAGEKRVFIVGESVAQQFFSRTDYLGERLSSALPGYSWRVINCGMSCYDSYRAMLLTREIVNYEPDLVIFMAGNNAHFNPATQNHWKYKYPLIGKVWVLRLLTDFINRPLAIGSAPSDDLKFFKENLVKTARYCRAKNVPLAVLTLPRHTRLFDRAALLSGDKASFLRWWLLEKSPKSLLSLESADNLDKAAACEKMGLAVKAAELYRRHTAGLYTTGRYAYMKGRNDALRQLAANTPGVILVDLEAGVLEETNGSPGPDVFYDTFHYWPFVYEYISDKLIEAVYQYDVKTSGTVLAWAADFKKEKLAPSALNVYRQKSLKPFAQAAVSLNDFSLPTSDFLGRLQALRYAASLDPSILRGEYFRSGRVGLVTGEYYNLLVLGETFRVGGDRKCAMKYYNAAVGRKPQGSEAYFFRGLCFYGAGEKKKAAADLAVLKSLNPAFGWLSIEYLDSLSRRHSAP